MMQYTFSIFFFFQAEDGIRDKLVTGVQTCALPISLNALEFAVLHTAPGADGLVHLNKEALATALQKKSLRYDKGGEEHYNVISAFIKSLRDSDPDGALYWLARMLEAGESPRFIARRMVILASEDVGNAHPMALVVATAVAQAVE